MAGTAMGGWFLSFAIASYVVAIATAGGTGEGMAGPLRAEEAAGLTYIDVFSRWAWYGRIASSCPVNRR